MKPLSARSILVDLLLVGGLVACASALRATPAQEPAAGMVQRFSVGAGKSRLIDMPVNIERVAVAAPEVAEAVPVSARTVMIDGRQIGATTLMIWLNDGTRFEYDVQVTMPSTRLEVADAQIEAEFGGTVHLTLDQGSAYLTGQVANLYAAQRAESIAASLGHVINLLKVDAPEREEQVLLKVRFADVDRSKSNELGINFFGSPGGYPFSATTGQFPASTVSSVGGGGSSTAFSLSDALDLFLFDPHLNVGATLQALENKNILEILAEPNVLAMNGHEASFIAGGEFPFPSISPSGAGGSIVTATFKEYGVRIHFLPVVTPRGTIRLRVQPEVSSLDYSNALSISGYTVPALATRRIDTEIELENGQSFAIAGLLDNQTTESLSKIPGLSSIPVLGKFFQSRSISKTNSELLVIVTPQLVAPIPEGEALPDLPRPSSFLEGPGILNQPPQTPSPEQTGPAPNRPARKELSIQEMQKLQRDADAEKTLGTPANGGSFLNNSGDMSAPPAPTTGTGAATVTTR